MTEKESFLYPPLPDRPIDFVIVTALAEERDAVLLKIPGHRQLSPAKDDIRTYFQADLPATFPDNTTGTYRVIVMCLLDMGRVQAVVATADAIRRWHPRYIMLVGIAGGLAARNVQIGDILISDQVVDYELQKLTPNGPEIRWDVQHADARLLNACNNFRNENWQNLIAIKRPVQGKIIRHIGPIASGDKVIAFSDILIRYQDVWPKLLGVEMEAAGAATAAFQSSDRPGFFMVRGVSDLADENKSSSNVKKWRSYACDAAASFTITLLKSGPIPLSEGTNQEKTKKVELIPEGKSSEFTSSYQQDIVVVLAALLRIDPSNIQFLKTYKSSIRITLEMPESAADRLYEFATMRDIRIISLGINSVLVEGKDIIKLSDEIGGVPGNTQLPIISKITQEDPMVNVIACSRCQHINPPDALFCEDCGKPLAAEGASQPSRPPEPQAGPRPKETGSSSQTDIVVTGSNSNVFNLPGGTIGRIEINKGRGVLLSAAAPKICPGCKTPYTEKDHFCRICGDKLP